MTKLVIGLDEAGYGPNLGPLCIGASVWELPQSTCVTSLAAMLSPRFRPKSCETAKYPWIPLGDSKQIYRSGSSRPLSAGVLALLAISGQFDQEWSKTLSAVCLKLGIASTAPWELMQVNHPDLFFDLSTAFDAEVLDAARAKLDEHQVQLQHLKVLEIPEARFNRGLDQGANKGNLLTEATLWLAKDLLDQRLSDSTRLAGYSAIEIHCDKHGGRNKYMAPLSQFFEDAWIAIETESTAISAYHSKWRGLPIRWTFQAKGDSIVPCSAASMIAKWMREISMSRINAFWRSHLPHLKPSAGYPVDAKRFAAEIEPIAARLNLARDLWWRRS